METIFLSHSSKDRDFVNQLALDLSALGFSVWYDQWELDVGDSLLTKIQEGIGEASFIAVVLSPSSVGSKWVQEELNAGLVRQFQQHKSMERRQVLVLPILYKDCEVPEFLRDKVYADFRNDYEHGLRSLLGSLTLRIREYHVNTSGVDGCYYENGVKMGSSLRLTFNDAFDTKIV